MSSLDMSKESGGSVPHGALPIVVLQTLHSMGPLHGYALARRIEQVAGATRISQGAIYPVLIRLEQDGWVSTEWGLSETNRRVKVYALTKAGRQQLRREVAEWARAHALIARFVEGGR
jgi:PadR family transcriptional regulator, regulatory protein PadR